MSRGHGWIERELIALFDDQRQNSWTIAELCRAIFSPHRVPAGVRQPNTWGEPIEHVPVTKAQRVAVLRALRTSGADQLAWRRDTSRHKHAMKRGATHERRFQRTGTATQSAIWAWRVAEEGPIWAETTDNRITDKRVSLTLHDQKIVLRTADLRPMPASLEIAKGWTFVWTRSLLNGHKAQAAWAEHQKREAMWAELRERNSRLRLTEV